VSEETAVSGSAPDAKLENQETQTEAAVQPSKGMSLSDSIREEIEALGESGLQDSDESGDDDSDAVDEDESEVEESEDSEEEDEEEEDDSDEDESEDEDDEDEDTEAKIPRTRLNKEIEKTKRAKADLEQAQSLISELESQIEGSKELQQYKEYIEHIVEMAEFMPDLREALNTLPVFTGAEPTIDDFENAEKYAEWREREAEKRFNKSQTSKSEEAQTEAQVNEMFDSFEKEIKSLREGDLAKFVDEDHMVEIRSFLDEQGVASLMSGSKRFDSIEKIAKFLFIDEMIEDLKKSGADAAIKKIDKSRKKVSIKSKGSGKSAHKKQDPRKMTVAQLIKQEIADAESGL
jgi:hypothetical protein